jgi:hypothetical protein
MSREDLPIDPAARTDLTVYERGQLLAEMAYEEIQNGVHPDFASKEEAFTGYGLGAYGYLQSLESAGSQDAEQIEFLQGFLNRCD